MIKKALPVEKFKMDTGCPALAEAERVKA